MYSWEIDNILKDKVNIDYNTYVNIINTSPQINWMKYNAGDNSVEMTDNEGHKWKFGVFHKERKF